MSSASAFLPLAGMATYAATKAFGLHLARALAEEHAGSGVRVLAVCPGPTRTEFSAVMTAEGARGGRAAGRWPSRMPWDDPADVVEASLRALETGRSVVATGAVARTTRVIASVVPFAVLARLRRLAGRLR